MLEREDDFEEEMRDELGSPDVEPPIEAILSNTEAKVEILSNSEASRRHTLSQADKQIADGFKTKTQTLIWVMHEIRQALAMTNRSQETMLFSDESKEPADYVFGEEKERKRLKEQYGRVLDSIVRYSTQIDPINEKK